MLNVHCEFKSISYLGPGISWGGNVPVSPHLRSLTGSHSLSLHLVPAKIQKGSDNTKARKGATVTLTAEIMGEPAPVVGWTKDGQDIEEDDRRGRRPAAGPGLELTPGLERAQKPGGGGTGAEKLGVKYS